MSICVNRMLSYSLTCEALLSSPLKCCCAVLMLYASAACGADYNKDELFREADQALAMSAETVRPASQSLREKWLLGVWATGLALLLDRQVEDWAKTHRQDRFNKNLSYSKDVLPLFGIAFAGLTTFQSPWTDAKLAHTSSVALASTMLTWAEVVGIKLATGRDRPGDSDSPYSFRPPNRKYDVWIDGASFPSGHTALSWAVVTPYARAYDLPWLYVIPVLSGIGRVADDAHWLSDVVAGSFIGYYTADFVERHFPSGDFGMLLTPNGVMIIKRF